MKASTLPLLLILLILLACNDSEQTAVAITEAPTDTTTIEKEVPKADLPAFNDVSGTREKLSGIGIGAMGAWKNDFQYYSVSPYYQFGRAGSTGMQNNLAFYLESDQPQYIKNAKLVLNINNAGDEKSALNELSNTSEKMFSAFDLKMPEQIKSGIKSKMPVKIEMDNYNAELKLEKSNISSWHVIIESK